MRISRVLVLLIPLLVPAPATASLIYIGDGGVHDVGTPTGDSYGVESGTLNLLPGANVSSVGGGAAFGESIHSVLITMSGGATYGIDVTRGDVTVSGGQAGNAHSADGLTIFHGTANITGGTFVGGNSPTHAASAVVGSAGTDNGVPVLSTLNISGGTFQGGTGSGGYYGGTTGYSLVSIGNTTVTGGHFLSPIAINTSLGGVTDFLGTNLSYHDHILSGILQNGDSINVRVYPDIADATVNGTGTEVRFGRAGPASPVLDPPMPVPEPASALVFGLFAALGLAHRRSRRGR
jgi:hypothetical protein